jgi:flagellin-like protein
MKEAKMKKGITPVISIIILLLITISLAGAAWTYLQGVLLGQISKTFQILPNGAFCVGGNISVYVQNTGYSGDLTDEDFIVATINGTDVKAYLQDVTIEQGNANLVLDYGGTDVFSSGYHQIYLATSSMVQETRVRCP